jgi:hypothetical protein
MKKALATLATILAIAGCSDKTIEGKVVGENEINLGPTEKNMLNVSKGRTYAIQDDSGNYYLFLVTNGEDPLNVGDQGTFSEGDSLFTGSFERNDNGKKVLHEFSAYTLKGYSLK